MVSVILRSRNEERYIGFAIQSLHDFFGYDLEIVLVDNESTDNTIRVVNSFEYLNIKKITINKNDYTPGKSLNLGLESCNGEIVLCMSSHCQITNLNLDKIQAKLEDNVAVWGKQIPIWDGKKVSRRYMWSNFKDVDQTNYFCELENRYFLHNAFCFYKKEILIENLFDEKYSGKEDRYWVNDMINKGHQVYYDSEMICNHFYTDNGATWKGIG